LLHGNQPQKYKPAGSSGAIPRLATAYSGWSGDIRQMSGRFR